MQILFVHPNFPAQFGHIASRLVQRPDVDCVFVSRAATGTRDGIRCVQYTTRGGAPRSNHYCSRTFENAVWSAHGVYEACRSAPRTLETHEACRGSPAATGPIRPPSTWSSHPEERPAGDRTRRLRVHRS